MTINDKIIQLCNSSVPLDLDNLHHWELILIGEEMLERVNVKVNTKTNTISTLLRQFDVAERKSLDYPYDSIKIFCALWVIAQERTRNAAEIWTETKAEWTNLHFFLYEIKSPSYKPLIPLSCILKDDIFKPEYHWQKSGD